MSKYTVKSIKSVSQSAMKQRNDGVRYKRGLDIGYKPLVLKRGLLPWILEHRTDIKLIGAKYDVKRAWVIGSVAEGTDTTMSDVDFWLDKNVERVHMSLLYELAEFLRYPVDVFYEGIEGLHWDSYVEPFGHVEL